MCEEETIEQLRAKCKRMKEERDGSGEVQTYSSRPKRPAAEIAALRLKCDALTSENEKLEEKIEQLKAQIKASKSKSTLQENKKLKEELKTQDKLIARIETENHKLEYQITILKEQNKMLEEENKKFKAEKTPPAKQIPQKQPIPEQIKKMVEEEELGEDEEEEYIHSNTLSDYEDL